MGLHFHHDDSGANSFPKQLITHAEKVRYVLQVVKGVGERGEAGRPTNVYREVPDDELQVPLSQIIYLGDGASDLPVFGLLNENGGIALAIFKANYAPDSELMRSLTLAVESVCKRIALGLLSQGE